MRPIPEFEKVDIESEKLIGTKWVGWGEQFSNRIKVEFVDNAHCIYTSNPCIFSSERKDYPMTYTVTEGVLKISEISEPFELRGNILFNGDLPVFEKAA